jgi:hypothetical protein
MNQKKDWRSIGKFWAASGVLKRYKPTKDHREMRAYISGLLQGLIIGAIVAAILTAITIWGR